MRLSRVFLAIIAIGFAMRSEGSNQPTAVSVVVRDAGGQEATHLRIALWDRAYAHNAEAPSATIHLMERYGFQIEITDTQAAGNTTEGETRLATITSLDFEDVVVDKIIVPLKELGDSGKFRPEPDTPFVLTTFERDDEFKIDGEKESNKDTEGPSKDRSIRIMVPQKAVETKDHPAKLELGGKIRIETDGLGSPKELPFTVEGEFPLKTYNVHGVVLKQGGTGVITEAEFRQAIARANHVWAQAGVRFIISSIDTIDPPDGVDLNDGLQVKAVEPNVSAEEKT